MKKNRQFHGIRLIYPDMEAIAKRDAFLSDKNGQKLQEIMDRIHLMKEILDKRKE